MPQISYFLKGQNEQLWAASSDIVPQKDDVIHHVEHREPTALEIAGLGLKATDPVYVHGHYLVIRRMLNVRTYKGARRLEEQGWKLTVELIEQYDEFPTRK